MLTLCVAFIVITNLSSCNEWLDVKPSNQIAADELFQNEDGFKVALSGAYTLMGTAETYGGDMTFIALDYLGGYWNINDFSRYYELANYALDLDVSKNFTDKMWKGLYNVIANVNDILFYIDDRKDVFVDSNAYSIIKAEALAIRAYIHLDILRLYAPYTFNGEGDTSIKWLPYVDEYTKNTTMSITNDEFAKLVMKDIDDAIALLKDIDPIITEKVPSDLFFTDRHMNLNYYAVKALKARASMYFGDETTALAEAQEVIAAQTNTRFRWVTSNEVTFTPQEHRDRTFSSEHIFALHIHSLEERGGMYLGFTETGVNVEQLIIANPTYLASFDFRNYFISNGRPTKLSQPEEQIGTNLLEQKLKRMPMIRISEMYYIAAECTGDVKYLNSVRLNRGYETHTPQHEFDMALEDEISAEFICEGQRFYYYKRIGKDIENVEYTAVLPNIEIDFGGRPRFEIEEKDL